jgi:CelD/BcsL family acetyltransferase involved in cellulose biosynthesis
MSGARVLTEWADEPFSHHPLAPATGPFPHRPFLETWWRHEGNGDQLALVADDTSALPLRVSAGRVMFCGDADVTDYHSPLGEPRGVIDAAADRFSGWDYSFDSLPEAAAAPLHGALDDGGHTHAVTREAVTAVLELPDDAGVWLAGLGKKDRHEIRRKRRRFEETLGSAHLERSSDAGAVATFADLHRTSPGAKGGFMTPEREAFFADLVHRAGATVDVLVAAGRPVSAAFAFQEPDGYYLYNSAYAPEAAAASPGIVLLAIVIERLIAEGVPRLDLLKGDEPYKFRLGATPRQLYRIEGTFA